MGRLIDADELLDWIQNCWDWATVDGITSTTVLKQTMTDISQLPTVEAIPKDQYEARLKADMVAMLTELHLKMEELGDDLDPTEDWDYGYKSGVEDMIQLLDERIDKLKGESDAQEQKKE